MVDKYTLRQGQALPILQDKIPLADPDLRTPIQIDIQLGIMNNDISNPGLIHLSLKDCLRLDGGQRVSSQEIVMKVAKKPSTNQLLEYAQGIRRPKK